MLHVVDQHSCAVVELESVASGGARTARRPDGVTGPLTSPYAATPAGDGCLAVADAGRVVLLDLSGGPSTAVEPAVGAAVGPLRAPRGVAVSAAGHLVVADTGNRRVVWSAATVAELRAGTADLADWQAFGAPSTNGSTDPGQFVAPTAVAVDPMGRTWVADPGLGRLVRVDDPNGSGWHVTPLPEGVHTLQPYGLALHPQGLLVSDLRNSRVLLVDLADDDAIATVLLDGAPGREFLAPVAVTPYQDGVVVADAAAARLVHYSPSQGQLVHAGELLGGAGPGDGLATFTAVTGLAATGAQS